AVLGPHHRENPELGQRGLAAQGGNDAVVLLRFESVSFEKGRVNCAHDRGVPQRKDRYAVSAPLDASAATTDSKRTSPSSLPSAASQARSGCGIRPTTLRVSLQM